MKNFNIKTFPETYRNIETKLTKFGYKLMATYSTRKSDGKIVSHIRNVNFVNIWAMIEQRLKNFEITHCNWQIYRLHSKVSLEICKKKLTFNGSRSTFAPYFSSKSTQSKSSLWAAKYKMERRLSLYFIWLFCKRKFGSQPSLSRTKNYEIKMLIKIVSVKVTFKRVKISTTIFKTANQGTPPGFWMNSFFWCVFCKQGNNFEMIFITGLQWKFEIKVEEM